MNVIEFSDARVPLTKDHDIDGIEGLSYDGGFVYPGDTFILFNHGWDEPWWLIIENHGYVDDNVHNLEKILFEWCEANGLLP